MFYFQIFSDYKSFYRKKLDESAVNFEENLNLDKNYKTLEAARYDYLITQSSTTLLKTKETEQIIDNIYDNYYFIHKHYGKSWVLYILLIRLFSFKIQVDDFYALCVFFKKRKQSNTNVCFSHTTIKSFSNSQISVIIPSYNRFEHLKSIVKNLSKQNHPIKEVIIVLQDTKLEEDLKPFFPNTELKIIESKTIGQCTARNRGAKIASSEILLFCDDDNKVKDNWVLSHIINLQNNNCDISIGPSSFEHENKWTLRLAEHCDAGNMMIKKSVFEYLGGFDERFDQLYFDDYDLGFRAAKNNLLIIENKDCNRINRLSKLGGLRGNSKKREIDGLITFLKKHKIFNYWLTQQIKYKFYLNLFGKKTRAK